MFKCLKPWDEKQVLIRHGFWNWTQFYFKVPILRQTATTTKLLVHTNVKYEFICRIKLGEIVLSNKSFQSNFELQSTKLALLHLPFLPNLVCPMLFTHVVPSHSGNTILSIPMNARNSTFLHNHVLMDFFAL